MHSRKGSKLKCISHPLSGLKSFMTLVSRALGFGFINSFPMDGKEKNVKTRCKGLYVYKKKLDTMCEY